ncbi:MAG: fructosamine kinase family protein [Myxococcota bacterium]|nr:fructosamine kinase family protein [Myxococcota bacterium]
MMDLHLKELVSHTFGHHSKIVNVKPLSGGCINTVQQLQLDNGMKLVAKTNPKPPPLFFESEAIGLQTLAKAPRGPDVPEVLAWNEHALLLTYIDTRKKNDLSAAKLGKSLAYMHRQIQPHYGFENNNFLGESPQPNPKHFDGITFFQRARLQHFHHLAHQRCVIPKSISKSINILIEELPTRLEIPNSEGPSLLHGDLWSGNWIMCNEGKPWLIDPACHYGFRESEIAMTELFGGFPPAFYAAYQETYPLSSSYIERRPIYQLVHMLNHVALFGQSYLSSCKDLLAQLKPSGRL